MIRRSATWLLYKYTPCGFTKVPKILISLSNIPTLSRLQVYWCVGINIQLPPSVVGESYICLFLVCDFPLWYIWTHCIEWPSQRRSLSRVLRYLIHNQAMFETLRSPSSHMESVHSLYLIISMLKRFAFLMSYDPGLYPWPSLRNLFSLPASQY